MKNIGKYRHIGYRNRQIIGIGKCEKMHIGATLLLIQLYTCDCSIRVTAVLEYLESANSFHCASIINRARPIVKGVVIVIA